MVVVELRSVAWPLASAWEPPTTCQIVFKITLLKCVVSGTKLSNWKTSTGIIIIVHNENYRGATLEI